jgi:hypothetical protein
MPPPLGWDSRDDSVKITALSFIDVLSGVMYHQAHHWLIAFVENLRQSASLWRSRVNSVRVNALLTLIVIQKVELTPDALKSAVDAHH